MLARDAMRVLVVFSVLLPLTVALAQNPAPPAQTPAPSEALRILQEVSQKYADATSYHMEAVEEETSSNDLYRDWRKTIMSIMVAPGQRYRYEGHTGEGSGLIVSDGKTIWTYHYDEQMYAQRAAVADEPSPPRLSAGGEEEGVQKAEHLRQYLAHLADPLNSAELLAEEDVLLDGRHRHCVVIQYTAADLKGTTAQAKAKEQAKLWVDPQAMVIVKMWRRGDGYSILPGSHVHVPLTYESTTVFPLVDLNAHLPDSAFVFTPPAEATLVDGFPAKRPNDLLGKVAPDVELKTAEGAVVHLSSFRGKPVLIDVWARWCAPCVAMIPELKKLNEELTAHGAVFVTVDQDEDASTGTAFLKGEKAEWQNFHDVNDALPTAFHAMNGLPWQVLLDSDGKVAFYQAGENISSLRAAIAKLGPQYSSMAPNPAPRKDE